MKLLNKFFKGKKKKEAYLALDIGTEFAKALVFEIESSAGGDKALILGVGRQRQRLSDMQSGAVSNIGGVVESCNSAIERAEEMAGLTADKVIVGIAGELVKGATSVVNYQRLNPKKKIDLAELNKIIDQVQWKSFDKVRKELSWETGYSEIDVKLVNAAVVDVKIDGYKVTNPLGFQGKDVSVSIFNAFAPLIHLGALQTITQELGLELISIAAEPFAVARSFGTDESSEFSAIFIDIGGGTTDIAVVRNGGVEGTKMFAIGGRSFTKRLTQVFGNSFSESEDLKIAYSGGLLDQKTIKTINEAFVKDCEVWLSGVELSLGEFGQSDALPQRILLCGGGSALPEIKQVLGRNEWWGRLPFSQKPKISFIKPKDIKTVVDATGKLKDQQDITPMGLANLILEMGGKEEVVSGILGRLVKVMQT